MENTGLENIPEAPATRQNSLSFQRLLLYAACLGVCMGGVSVAYYTALQLGIQLIWQTLPNLIHAGRSGNYRYWAWILTTIGGFLVGLTVRYLPVPGGLNAAIDEIHRKGRIDYRQAPGMLIASLLSLVFGSSAGPEAPLVDIHGGLGSWLGDRLKVDQNTTRILTFCGMSAALGAFFGSPLGSALLALELPHRLGLEYYEALLPVIVSAIMGFAVFRSITGLTIGGFYEFPPYPELHAIDLLYAALLGVVGAAIAVSFVLIFHSTRHLTRFCHHRPVLLSTLGGLAIGLVAMFLPLTLFYGEQQIQTIINTGASMGMGLLFMTGLGKILAVSLSLQSGFRGGFIFPLFFIGADFGMIASLLMPQIPVTVCVICIMAAVAVAILRTPISIVLILSVLSHTELIPVVTVAAISSFLLTNRLSLITTQRSRFSLPNLDK